MLNMFMLKHNSLLTNLLVVFNIILSCLSSMFIPIIFLPALLKIKLLKLKKYIGNYKVVYRLKCQLKFKIELKVKFIHNYKSIIIETIL